MKDIKSKIFFYISIFVNLSLSVQVMLRHYILTIMPECCRGLEEGAAVIYHALAVTPTVESA